MSDTLKKSTNQQTVGLFDIRNIIGALLGIYGVVIFLLGIFNASDWELDKADGININLWAGIGMIVVAALFLAWAKLRPTYIPDDFEAGDDEE